MEPDSTNVRARKSQLRRELRQILLTLPEEHRRAASSRACALLRKQKIWRDAASILFYAPMPGELDIWPLLLEAITLDKQVLLPRFVPELGVYEACLVKVPERDLSTGAFGIREGAAHCPALRLNVLDLALVPGVAFDPHGRRLGRGKGFYDQLLSATRGSKCGVAFDEQLLPEVPVEPHDIVLNCILTPTRFIEL